MSEQRTRWPAAVSYAGQAVCYAAFVGVVGYFSASPAYEHLSAGEALLKLSVQHAGARVAPCHERTPEELAKLAPNMRAAMVCPRERAPVRVHVALDDRPLFEVLAPPSGLGKDGASAIYDRTTIPAGTHRLRATLVDSVGGAPVYAFAETVSVAPGRVIVLDFDDGARRWILRQ